MTRIAGTTDVTLAQLLRHDGFTVTEAAPPDSDYTVEPERPLNFRQYSELKKLGIWPLRASGGIVPAGSVHLVGEKGPELVVPAATAVMLDKAVIRALADSLRRAIKRRDDPLCEVVDAFHVLAAACRDLTGALDAP
jgi:hypothetical protein